MAARLLNEDNKGACKGGAASAHEHWYRGHCQNTWKIRLETVLLGKARFLYVQPAMITSTIFSI